MIIHDRRFFYKYSTSETALLILENRKLRYSSPVFFNDPFDVQTTLDYGFTLLDLNEALQKELDRLTESEEEPPGIPGNPWYEKLLQVRQAKRGRSKSAQIQIELLREIHKQSLTRDHEKRREIRIKEVNAWWRNVVKATTVFCVAEEKDNLLMWAHYANDHRGVVLEFECLSELDNPLCAARKVKYVEKPPVFGELDEYVKCYTGQIPPLEHDTLYYDLMLSKSRHWAYEKEWRVFIPPYDMENPTIPREANGNEILFELVRLYPQELSAVYFGCRIDPKDRKKIEECLVGDLRHAKCYYAIRNERQYRLDFVAKNQQP